MPELNNPDTLVRARDMIRDLSTATSRAELWDLEQAAWGWLNALLAEQMIDRPEFDRLSMDLNRTQIAWRDAAEAAYAVAQ